MTKIISISVVLVFLLLAAWFFISKDSTFKMVSIPVQGYPSGDPRTVSVRIDLDGNLIKRTKRELLAYRKTTPDVPIHFEVDARCDFGKLQRTLQFLHSKGVKQVGIVADQGKNIATFPFELTLLDAGEYESLIKNSDSIVIEIKLFDGLYSVGNAPATLSLQELTEAVYEEKRRRRLNVNESIFVFGVTTHNIKHSQLVNSFAVANTVDSGAELQLVLPLSAPKVQHVLIPDGPVQ